MKDLVIFDLDRTIYNGSLGQEFIIHLVGKNLIPPQIIPELTKLLIEYESEILDYKETVFKILNFLAKGLIGTDFELIRSEAQNFIYKNHHKFYDYAFEIPKLFPQFEYVLLSLEPDFLVQEVCNLIKIKNGIGNKFSHNEKFDNGYQITIDKTELFKNSKFSSYSILAAFGDSIADYEILKMAKHSILVNPDDKIKLLSENEGFITANPKTMYDSFKKLVS